MRAIFMAFMVMGLAGQAQAMPGNFNCQDGVKAAQEVIKIANDRTSLLRALRIKHRCENGAKELIELATSLCSVGAYYENVNLDEALAYCQRVERYSYDQLRNID